MLTKNSMEDHVKNISRLIRKGPPPSREMVAEHRSEEHTSELQSQSNLVCRLLLEKKKTPRQALDAPVSVKLHTTPTSLHLPHARCSIRHHFSPQSPNRRQHIHLTHSTHRVRQSM